MKNHHSNWFCLFVDTSISFAFVSFFVLTFYLHCDFCQKFISLVVSEQFGKFINTKQATKASNISESELNMSR